MGKPLGGVISTSEIPVSNLDVWARHMSAAKQTERHNVKAILEMHIDGIHKVLR
jgi:hypothetical protein